MIGFSCRSRVASFSAAAWIIATAVAGLCASDTFAAQDAGESAEQSKPPVLTEEEQALVDEFARNLARAIAESRFDFLSDDFSTVLAKQATVSRALYDLRRTVTHAIFEITPFALDYSRYVAATVPRLSGRTVRVGPERAVTDLAAALPTLQWGDLVILDAGEYELGPDRSRPTIPGDVAIIGQGPDATTLRTGQLAGGSRVLISNVTIDCNNSPFLDLRGGAAFVRDCVITNYNSGAGGSNSIYATGSTLLIERCAFEGNSGRSAGRAGGVAFDLRGGNFLFVRQTQFIDNDEIVRSEPHFVFDGCVSMSRYSRPTDISGSALVRDCRFNSRYLQPTTFTHALDDSEVVLSLVDPDAPPLDDATAAMVDKLELERRLTYWIPLVRHANEVIRSSALAQVETLTGVDPMTLAAPLPELPDDLELETPLRYEFVYAALMRWYEKNADSLMWDEQAGRYRLPD